MFNFNQLSVGNQLGGCSRLQFAQIVADMENESRAKQFGGSYPKLGERMRASRESEVGPNRACVWRAIDGANTLLAVDRAGYGEYLNFVLY